MELTITKFQFLVVLFNAHFILFNLADDDFKFDIYYERIVTLNGTDEHFGYKVNSVKKDATQNIFTVDAMIDIKQDISNEWKILIEIYELDESSKEYKSLFGLPHMSTCIFMTTIYKTYFYDEISKYSNLPSYDACPVPKGQYDIKGYPLEMDKFRDSPLKSLAKPGSYRLDVFMVKDDVAQYGVSIYGRITEKS